MYQAESGWIVEVRGLGWPMPRILQHRGQLVGTVRAGIETF
jgi:hypothetical protein